MLVCGAMSLKSAGVVRPLAGLRFGWSSLWGCLQASKTSSSEREDDGIDALFARLFLVCSFLGF